MVPGTLSDSPNRDSYSSSTERFCRRFVYLATIRNLASTIVRQDRQNLDLRLDRESINGPWSELGPYVFGKFEPKDEPVLIEFLTYEKA